MCHVVIVAVKRFPDSLLWFGLPNTNWFSCTGTDCKGLQIMSKCNIIVIIRLPDSKQGVCEFTSGHIS